MGPERSLPDPGPKLTLQQTPNTFAQTTQSLSFLAFSKARAIHSGLPQASCTLLRNDAGDAGMPTHLKILTQEFRNSLVAHGQRKEFF